VVVAAAARAADVAAAAPDVAAAAPDVAAAAGPVADVSDGCSRERCNVQQRLAIGFPLLLSITAR